MKHFWCKDREQKSGIAIFYVYSHTILLLFVTMSFTNCTKEKEYKNCCPETTVLPDVNQSSIPNDSLVLAAEKGDTSLMLQLINAGIPVNSFKNRQEYTPLIGAARWNQMEAISLLLDKGANINGTDEAGLTPLIACLNGAQVKMVELLLSKGADPNQCTRFKYHPIEIWIKNFTFFTNYDQCPQAGEYSDNQIKILELLIKNGATTMCNGTCDDSIPQIVKRKYDFPNITDFSYFMCNNTSIEDAISEQLNQGKNRREIHAAYLQKKTRILTLLKGEGS